MMSGQMVLEVLPLYCCRAGGLSELRRKSRCLSDFLGPRREEREMWRGVVRVTVDFNFLLTGDSESVSICTYLFSGRMDTVRRGAEMSGEGRGFLVGDPCGGWQVRQGCGHSGLLD